MSEKEERPSLRPVAFAAVVFSTVALTSCLLTFPMILHYVQTLESQVQLDLEYCQVTEIAALSTTVQMIRRLLISVIHCLFSGSSKRYVEGDAEHRNRWQT